MLSSVRYGEEVSMLTGLPVVMTTIEEDLYDTLKDRVENLFPLKLQKRPAD